MILIMAMMMMMPRGLQSKDDICWKKREGLAKSKWSLTVDPNDLTFLNSVAPQNYPVVMMIQFIVYSKILYSE